jgi:hypothetical protein
MTVYAPTVAGSTWTQDVARASGNIADVTSTLTCPAVTTNTNGALVVSFVASTDNNNCSLTTAGNWTSAIVGLDNAGGTGQCINVHYVVQGTAGSTGTYVLTENAGGGDSARYTNQAWYETAPATTKYLKLLVHPSAQSVGSVSGVVFTPPTGGDITGTKIGEFTGAAFEGTLESSQAVLLVNVTAFSGSSLTTDDAPVALVRTATLTTGAVVGSVVEG